MRASCVAMLLCLTAAWSAQAAPKLEIRGDADSGLYQPGTSATWTIHVTDDGRPAAGTVSFSVRRGGLDELQAGKLELADGKAQISATRQDPGTLLLTIKYAVTGSKEELTAYGAAAFAPEQIRASLPPPDDFDSFWQAKIAELDAVPMHVQLEPIDVGDPKVEYFKVTLDNIRGRRIYGQLAKAAGKSDLPALLQVQWAGVYSLHRDWVLGQARSGWLSLNISAHDLPIDQPNEFYAAKSAKELNDYPGQGNDDRETSYFLPMFLSCRRAVDYLTQRPDWNQRTLVVHGGSQGGYQAIVTAGIHPAVTAFAAAVPAGCDHTGRQAGRSPGWPNWAGRTWQGKDEQKMLATARYFDALNFATRVKCPSLVGVGLIDTVCPAEGVLATCNQLPAPKTIVIMPRADHGGDHQDYSVAFSKFLEQQKSAEK